MSAPCLVTMVLSILGPPRNVNSVAYQAFIKAIPAAVQPKTNEFANALEETIEGAATRILGFTYLPIFIVICVIVIVLAVVEVISFGAAILLIIVAAIIFITFFFIAMRAYQRLLPTLTKQLQTDIFNALGIFGGVLFREIIFLSTCI